MVARADSRAARHSAAHTTSIPEWWIEDGRAPDNDLERCDRAGTLVAALLDSLDVRGDEAQRVLAELKVLLLQAYGEEADGGSGRIALCSVDPPTRSAAAHGASNVALVPGPSQYLTDELRYLPIPESDSQFPWRRRLLIAALMFVLDDCQLQVGRFAG